jgi:hypothetical protein
LNFGAYTLSPLPLSFLYASEFLEEDEIAICFCLLAEKNKTKQKKFE